MSVHSPTPPAPAVAVPLGSARSAIIAKLRAAGCVFAEEEAALLISAAGTEASLTEMVGRRVTGFPVEHVMGWAEFCSLRITITPGVFVPRRRSEFLVGQAIGAAYRAARHRPAGPATPSHTSAQPTIVVDLCCGSGAIGLAVAAALKGAELHAADIDPAAVQCARANMAAGGGLVYQGDLFGPLPAGLRGAVDVLIANAPYVPTGEIRLLPPEARLHEPMAALDGGHDGSAVQRRIAAEAPHWLAPRGEVLIETSEHQAPLTAAALQAAGLTAHAVSSDELGATVVVGSRPEG